MHLQGNCGKTKIQPLSLFISATYRFTQEILKNFGFSILK